MYDEKTIRKKWKDNTHVILNELRLEISKIEKFTSEEIETVFKQFLERNKIKMGVLLPVFRLSLTGLGMGPSLFNIAELIGKKETLSRIDIAIKKIKK